MSYKKYYLYKKQQSTDGGATWSDVIPLETSPSGDSIGTYNTLAECEYVPPTPVSGQYLTFVAQESGTFTFTKRATAGDIQYSLDSGSTWTQDTAVTVNNGDVIMWKGEMMPAQWYGVGTFSASTGSFEAKGNPMSLLYGDNFEGQTDLSGKDYAFSGLFKRCSGLTSINDLTLQATTLAQYCYRDMFLYCTSLTSVPSNLLPATTLTKECYGYMFYYCSSLTSVPNLPATTLAEYCYTNMFWGCTSLTSIPNGFLPATALPRNCYYEMFNHCTSLTTVPSDLLPATTLAYECYREMFYYCSSLTTAPVLPATTLAQSCYNQMFFGCTNLNYIKCLATNINTSNCTYLWVDGVAASGTFVKAASMNDWTSGQNGIPSGWTVQNA